LIIYSKNRKKILNGDLVKLLKMKRMKKKRKNKIIKIKINNHHFLHHHLLKYKIKKLMNNKNKIKLLKIINLLFKILIYFLMKQMKLVKKKYKV
jgi:hypothetical protein